MRTTILAMAMTLVLGTSAGHTASLTTGYGVSTSSASGVLFDITVGGQDLVLTQIGANMQANPGAAVFIRPGTHVGHELNGTGWTEIYNTNIMGNGNGGETVLDVDDYNLSASQTYGIAIVVPDRQEGGIGTSVGTVVVSNSDLSILEGTWTSSSHPSNLWGGSSSGVTHSPEVTIYYDVAAQAVPTTGPIVLALLAATMIGVVLWRRHRAYA